MLTTLLTTLALTTAAQASDIRHPAADVPTTPAQLVPLPDGDPDEDVDNAKPTGAAGSTVRIEDEPETAPLYVNARGSIAVPANGNGDVAAAGAGMGIVLKENQQLGLRFIYMHQPPSNPLSTTTPEVPWAWGPVLDWQYTFKPDTRASMFLASSLGYVYGTPQDGSDNVILPILEGGVGLRLSKKTRDGSRIFVAPQIGFVPGAVAPFTAIDIGMVLPGGKDNG